MDSEKNKTGNLPGLNLAIDLAIAGDRQSDREEKRIGEREWQEEERIIKESKTENT